MGGLRLRELHLTGFQVFWDLKMELLLLLRMSSVLSCQKVQELRKLLSLKRKNQVLSMRVWIGSRGYTRKPRLDSVSQRQRKQVTRIPFRTRMDTQIGYLRSEYLQNKEHLNLAVMKTHLFHQNQPLGQRSRILLEKLQIGWQAWAAKFRVPQMVPRRNRQNPFLVSCHRMSFQHLVWKKPCPIGWQI